MFTRQLASVAVGLLLVFGAGQSVAHADTPDQVDRVFPNGLPYALYEDGCSEGVKRCVWSSGEQGNGIGEFSILYTRFHGEYLSRRISNERAVRLTAAYCARPTVTCDGYFD